MSNAHVPGSRDATAASFDDVLKIIAELDSPPPGKVRVYRGQNRSHIDTSTRRISLLPGLLRPESQRDYDANWMLAVEANLAANPGILPLLSERRAKYDLWIPALIQHYGPGSFYLDVTSDPEIALWFGLHKWKDFWMSFIAGDSASDLMQRTFLTAWYTSLDVPERQEDWPVLYVFDLEPWSGSGEPRHGQLVDLLSLSIGKALAMAATRLRVQSASLLACNPHQPDPNLACMIRKVIALAPPFNKPSRRLGHLTNEIFPPPEKDPFYKALLAIPAVVRFEPLRQEHALAVPFYLNTDPPPGNREF